MAKLWGGRFEDAANPDAEVFGASIGFDHRLWPYDVAGSAAHCRMLAKQGILSMADAREILRGLDRVAGELAEGKVDFAPAWEDIHTRVEGRLRELIGDAAARLHTARSRNDQVALDLRMFAREAILHEVDALADLQEAMIRLGEQHPEAIMPGYTHLQRAQPVLFAHHALAYVEMFQRDAERLLDCAGRTDVLPLGSGALAGVPYALDRDETAKLLGFPSVSANSLDAVADRDFVVEHLAALALVGLHLSRLSEELILWSSAEFGFIQISDAFATGSSIMPQKRNPDVAELVRGKSGRVVGHLVGTLTVLKGLPLAYNKDLQEDKEALFDAVDTIVACLSITAAMLASTRVRTDRMAAAAGADFSTATDYADYLAKKGLPFREAHALVGKLVSFCEETRRDLVGLSLEELRGFSQLFEPDIVGLTPAAVVAARDVPGGTAPSRVRDALDSAQMRLQDLRADVERRRDRLPSLDRLLTDPLSPAVS
jgi:argininosuccinate lyase